MFKLIQRLSRMPALRQTLGGTSVTMAITGLGAVVSFAMFSVAARWLGPEEFGRFSAWFSAASFLAVLAGAGQETLIVRTWAEYTTRGQHGLARGAVLFGLIITLVGSLLVASLFIAGSELLDHEAAITLAAGLFIVSQALSHFGTNSSHNIVGYFIGQGSADVTWRLLVLVVIVTPLLPGDWHSATALLLVAATAQFLVFSAQLGAVYRYAPPIVRQAQTELRPKEWRDRGLRMWAAAIVEASSQYLDVVIVSILINPVAAGAYFAATRVANIFARMSSGMASYARRRVAPLYFAGKRDELIALSRSVALVMLVLVVSGLLVVALFGHALLSIFGSTFAEQTPALFILSLGTAATALSGPAPIFLQQTGHEGIYARIIWWGFVGRLVLMLILAPLFGTEGAATAWTLASIATAVAVTYACRETLGIDPSPFILLHKPGSSSKMSAPAPTPAEPRRIVMVQTQAEAAGAQEISRLIGEGLEARGFEVHHAFLFRRTKTLDFLPNAFFCADERPRGPIGCLRLLWRLWIYYRRLRPAAVFTFQHYSNILAAPVARAAGVSNVIATRTTSSKQLPRIVEHAEMLVGFLSGYTKFVVNSRESELEVARYPRALRRKAVRIDHGFGCKPSSLDKAAARRLFNLPAGISLLGCVARLHPQKNQRAAVRLLVKNPSWHLALAGQGPGRAALERLASKLGCADRLHFVGEITPQQIGDFLASLDVFVFPSLAESFGLAPVEAAQAGVPVVANALPVLREVLSIDGEPCAVFVDVNDTVEFAAAVAAVLGGGPSTTAMTERGRALSDKYSIDAMVDGYVGLLETQPGASEAGEQREPELRSEQSATEIAAPLARLMAQVPKVRIGGLPIAALDRRQTADLMIAAARVRTRGSRPLIFSSANGEVLSRCSSSQYVAQLFEEMDLLNADGQPLVVASRLMCDEQLPERVATTDLYHDVAVQAQRDGITFYMFGATETENARACERARHLYPNLKIVGRANGYVTSAELDRTIAEINALAPDILWVALGVPREQEFCRTYADRLTNVGLIKTSGGLFNFLSGQRSRAPAWMQRASLEWLWRMSQEPTRLFWRYVRTSPHALYLLVMRSG